MQVEDRAESVPNPTSPFGRHVVGNVRWSIVTVELAVIVVVPALMVAVVVEVAGV